MSAANDKEENKDVPPEEEVDERPKMTLANFKSDFLDFNFTREPKEISGDTTDIRCRILQMQDRAKLLLNYNKELEERTDKLKVER